MSIMRLGCQTHLRNRVAWLLGLLCPLVLLRRGLSKFLPLSVLLGPIILFFRFCARSVSFSLFPR